LLLKFGMDCVGFSVILKPENSPAHFPHREAAIDSASASPLEH